MPCNTKGSNRAAAHLELKAKIPDHNLRSTVRYVVKHILNVIKNYTNVGSFILLATPPRKVFEFIIIFVSL